MQSVADADEKITDSGYNFLRTKAAPAFQISGSGSDLRAGELGGAGDIQYTHHMYICAGGDPAPQSVSQLREAEERKHFKHFQMESVREDALMAVHRTMIVLRDEIEMKNRIIMKLRRQISRKKVV